MVRIPDEQIDYGALSANMLAQLAVQRDEPFIATSALGELGQRGDEHASKVACEHILDGSICDAHQLTTFALTSERDKRAPPHDETGSISRGSRS